MVVVLVFIGLPIIILCRETLRPANYGDYSCYYLASRCAVNLEFSDIYPVPTANAKVHPGYSSLSKMKPNYEKHAFAAGMVQPFRFIYSPLTILLMWPLGFFDPITSIWIFRLILMLCISTTAIIAGEVYQHFSGKYDYIWVGLVLLIAWCPLSWASVRVANTSPISGMMIALAVWGILLRKSWLVAIVLVFGAGLKFATIPLLLYFVVARDWVQLLKVLIVAILITGIIIFVMDISVVIEWLSLLQTFSMTNPGSLSLPGFLLTVLPENIYSVSHQIARFFSFLVLALIVFLAVLRFSSKYSKYCDGSAMHVLFASMLWFMVFSPSTGNHYFVYLYVFWGWLVANKNFGFDWYLVSAIVVFGTFIPISGSDISLPFVIKWHMFFVSVVALVWSIYSIWRLKMISLETRPS